MKSLLFFFLSFITMFSLHAQKKMKGTYLSKNKNRNWLTQAPPKTIAPELKAEKLSRSIVFLTPDSNGIVLFANTKPASGSDVKGILYATSIIKVISEKTTAIYSLPISNSEPSENTTREVWSTVIINKDTFYTDEPLSRVTSFNTTDGERFAFNFKMKEFNQYIFVVKKNVDDLKFQEHVIVFKLTNESPAELVYVSPAINWQACYSEGDGVQSESFYYDKKNKQYIIASGHTYCDDLIAYWNGKNLNYEYDQIVGNQNNIKRIFYNGSSNSYSVNKKNY